MKKIRILIIEDNRMLRASIAAMFKKQPDILVVSSVSRNENIELIIEKRKPDIILLDKGITHKESLQLVKDIKNQFKEIKLIIMGLVPIESKICEFIQAGVSGFILKDADALRFEKTIIKVNKGLKVLPPLLTGSLFSQIADNVISGSNSTIVDKSVRMTKREREVVALIADGLTNKEIAQKLKLSTYTVKSHVHNILEKLSLSTRVQIARHLHLQNSVKSAVGNTSLLEE
ncbi:MAG TPA: response regulator transcription factor [Ignavibacteriaceae bacterium]|nr:response regulator transcription factor [Ignavibacteriaceae bacterium]